VFFEALLQVLAEHVSWLMKAKGIKLKVNQAGSQKDCQRQPSLRTLGH
jgi:hypothetical protein